VHTVYNPLEYAAQSHRMYVGKFARKGAVLFLGMNPGPFGMAQTGVPFGAIPLVRDWMGIEAPVSKPSPEHPKRPVEGFACTRVEPSGKRLWGYFSEEYPKAEDFFARAFVYNYCPLAFMSESGANLTPDKFPRDERDAIYRTCQTALAGIVGLLEPRALVGIGAFAEERFLALPEPLLRGKIVARILHPSPASPLANKDWPGSVRASLGERGLWPLPPAA